MLERFYFNSSFPHPVTGNGCPHHLLDNFSIDAHCEEILTNDSFKLSNYITEISLIMLLDEKLIGTCRQSFPPVK